jgi:hypothetical protein
VVPVVNPSQETGQIGVERINQVSELLVVDNSVNLLPTSHVDKLRRREPGVHEQNPRTKLAGGHHGVNRPTVITS